MKISEVKYVIHLKPKTGQSIEQLNAQLAEYNGAVLKADNTQDWAIMNIEGDDYALCGFDSRESAIQCSTDLESPRLP